MQLKKIKPGVVYAEHGNGDYNRDNGRPAIVLDPTIWQRSHDHSATTYTRNPNGTAGSPSKWSRSVNGVPVLTLHGEVNAEMLAAFVAAAKVVADQLAAHTNGPFDPDVPAGDSMRFDVIHPRDVRAEWVDYAAALAERTTARNAARKRDEQRAQERVTAAGAARDRIAAVLPDAPVLATSYGRVPERPNLSWVELADLLDRYADARR